MENLLCISLNIVNWTYKKKVAKIFWYVRFSLYFIVFDICIVLHLSEDIQWNAINWANELLKNSVRKCFWLMQSSVVYHGTDFFWENGIKFWRRPGEFKAQKSSTRKQEYIKPGKERIRYEITWKESLTRELERSYF